MIIKFMIQSRDKSTPLRSDCFLVKIRIIFTRLVHAQKINSSSSQQQQKVIYLEEGGEEEEEMCEF